MNKSKTAFYFLFPVLIAGIVVRFFDLNTGIDFSTGFFHEGIGIQSVLFYLVFGIGLLIILGLLFLDIHRGSVVTTKLSTDITLRQQTYIGVCYLLGGGANLYKSILLFPNFGERFLELMFFIGGSAVFLIIGFLLLGTKKIKRSVAVMHIPLAAYFLINASSTFIKELVLTHISELLLELLLYILMVIFALSGGRFLAKVETKTSRIFLILSSFGATIIAFSLYFSRLAVHLFGAENVRSLVPFPSFELLAIGLLTFTAIFVLYKNPPKKKDEEQEWTV